MSDLGSRGDGSAKDRRTRLYNALVNRNTGEVRRPNQSELFRRSGTRFLKTGDNRYEQAVTFSLPGSSQKVTTTKKDFWRMIQGMEREYKQRNKR